MLCKKRYIKLHLSTRQALMRPYCRNTLSLRPAVRRTSEFSKLLTETRLSQSRKLTAFWNKFHICTVKKPAIISIYNKIKTRNIQIQHFNYKIVKQNTIEKRKKPNWHLGTKHGSPGDKSTTFTAELRGLSLQDSGAKNLKNSLIDFKANFIFWSFYRKVT